MFIQKAFRGTNELHWYLLTIFLVFLAWQIAGAIPLVAGVMYLGMKGGLGADEIMASMAEYDFAALGIDLNIILVLILLSFVIGLWALRGCIKKYHRKSIADATTGRSSWDWSRIKYGFGIWAFILVAMQIVSLIFEPENHVFQLEWAKFIPLVFIALIMIPLQTTFEELLFRGYFMQGIAVAAGNRWVPLILTSLGFGALHMFNPEVQEYGWQIMMVNYAGTGLLLGMMTLMDDGIELALGMHAANNIFASLFVTFEDSALQTYAIYSLKELDIHGATVGGIVVNVIFFFICKWKYGWTDWSKLYAKVVQPEEDIDLSSDILV